MTKTKRNAPGGRVAYVDGRYVPHAEAAVHIEDRGLQFADAIYEVCAVTGGQMLEEDEHLDRLERSLRELRMPMPMARGPRSCAPIAVATSATSSPASARPTRTCATA